MTTKSSPYTIPLEAGKYYHIFNRGINSQPIFFETENYKYFLVKPDDYFSDFLVMHAFILLRNHFHLLIEIKEEKIIRDVVTFGDKYAKLREHLNKSVPAVLSRQFQSFFICYANSINKSIGRHGGLFETPYRRKEIKSDEHYRNVMYYIHRNMHHHHLPFSYDDYTWSSYSRILEQRPSKLPKERIIKTFVGAENFVSYHSTERDLSNCIEELIDYGQV